jgi:hypothetical protein
MSRHQVRYAIQGLGTGLTASGVLISGTILIVQLSLGLHVGHRVRFGFVLFTAIFVLILYRLRRKYFHLKHKTARSKRSASLSAMTSAGDQNQKKGA